MDSKKYKSVCVNMETYNMLKKHSKLVLFDGVPLSISQTIQHHCYLADDYLNERELPFDCYVKVDTSKLKQARKELAQQVWDNKKLGEQSLSPLEAKVKGFYEGKEKTNANTN